MESSEALTGSGTVGDLIRRFLALFEVLLVALAGVFFVQLGFMVFNIGRSQLLGDTRILFISLASEACISLALIALFLRSRGQSFRTIGWIWKKGGREALLGISCVPFLFASTFLVGIFFTLVLPQYVSITNPLLDSVKGYGALIFLLVSSILVGGIKEEIQRAFVLDRFERYLGPVFLTCFFRIFGHKRFADEQTGRTVGLTVGLILWSLFFAVGHALQGVDSAAGAGILGLCFGLLYIWRRNLVAPMLAHALFDVTTLLIFWFFVQN